MTKLQQFFTKYKKECIALFIFVLCLCIFSVSYAFAAVEPVRSIVITSENTDFASSEEGSWQVTKSGYWTNYGEAEVTLDVDTSLMTNNEYTDIIFVLDISGSMSGDKLDRVKNDSKELISSLLSNQNNRAALITFDSSSQIVSDLTNDEEQLTNEIDNLQVTGSTNYYQALVNVDSILQNYQKETDREMVILFLTDGYPNEDTPNQVTQYQYLKNAYPYITINGIQYEMGNSILNPIKEISDNQFIADMETLNNVLFDASVSPIKYDTYQIIDYIDNDNFTLESKDNIKITTGKVELTEENGKQKIIWTIDNLSSGRKANLTMKLKLKDELLGQGGIYPTNESTEVVSKIAEQEEDVTTTNTPILSDNYKVIYDGNAPDGSTVTNVPEAYNYSVFSTIEISDQVPSCSGYEFKGWDITTSSVTRVSENYFIMPESDVIVKAEWSKVGITKSMNGTVNNMGDPIMKSYSYNSDTDYHSSTYKSKITSIVTKDNMEIPTSAIESWDVSAAGDGSVIAYIEDDGRGTGTYKVTIGAQGNIIANKDSSYLFRSFSNAESIDLTYLDTSQVTNMSRMFYYCRSLTSLDLSSFDTSQVTVMNSIFYLCDSLLSLNVSNFDTSQVTDMGYMFSDCNSLTSLDVSNFDTSQVTDMSYMFDGCRSLPSLNFGASWDTSKVTDMSWMFYLCGDLTNIIFESKWNTGVSANMNHMFSMCNNLTNLDLSNFDTSQVIDMSDMFASCSGLVRLDLSNFNTSKVTNMSRMFQGCGGLTSLDISSFDTSQVTDMSSMFQLSSVHSSGGITYSKLTYLDLNNFDTSKVTDMSDMFGGCDNLLKLILGNNFDTSQVTDMSDMFSSCLVLEDLNLSSFDTSQVTNMGSMFRCCQGLSSLDLSHFDTSQVTDMSQMFYGSHILLSLDLSSFDTSKVTDMSDMFASCSDLTSLDISNFDTSKVVDMSDMFASCSDLTSLDLNNFDTSQVMDMSSMFARCSGLVRLNLINFNTSKVTDMSQMFYDCDGFTSFDLSSFDTSQVTNMSQMFSYCNSLTSLDLSNFDTSKVTDMSQMFQECYRLTNLDVRNAIFNAISYSSMFNSVPNNINIIVKDVTAKSWIESRLSEASRTGTVTIASA